MGNIRQQLTHDDLNLSLEACKEKLYFRIRQKGLGSFASNHEILGIINQETTEYEEAIHNRVRNQDKIEELLDIAVAALIGVASISSGGVDW